MNPQRTCYQIFFCIAPIHNKSILKTLCHWNRSGLDINLGRHLRTVCLSVSFQIGTLKDTHLSSCGLLVINMYLYKAVEQAHYVAQFVETSSDVQ